MKRYIVFAAITFISSCDVVDQDDPNSAVIGQEIKGTVVTTDVWGIPKFTGTGGCTATQLSDYWTITARHCGISPYLRETSVTPFGGSAITVSKSYQHPISDVALLRLSSAGKGGGFHFHNGFYRGTTASLVGQTLQCFGYGPNVLNGAYGTLRTTTLTVVSAATDPLWGKTFHTAPVSGQTSFPGDSGGPCFYRVNQNGDLQLAGILMNADVNGSNYASVEGFRDWVDALLTGDMRPTEAVLNTDSYWHGQSSVLDKGYTFPAPLNLFVNNDAASSARVGSMVLLQLFADNNFGGTSKIINYPGTEDLRTVGFNDTTSSAKSFAIPCNTTPGANQITVFQHANFSGACDTIDAGSYDSLNDFLTGPGTISSLKVGSAVRARLYSDVGYASSFIDVLASTNVSDLTAYGFNDQTRSIRINGTNCTPPGPNEVVFWTDGQFLGSCAKKALGSYPTPTDMGVPNDWTSSVQVGTNTRLSLYDNAYFSGSHQHLRTDHPFLPALGFNDITSSARTTPQTFCAAPTSTQAVLYEHANFTGRCVVLEIGSYGSPLTTEFDLGNDMVSSLKVGPGRSVKLFADDQFTGTNATYNINIADLSVSSPTFNDSASSVIVF